MKISSLLFQELLFCLLLFAWGCRVAPGGGTLQLSKSDSSIIYQKANVARRMIIKMKPLIEAGDLILRTGKDFTSETLRQFSNFDKTYSHCGIASMEHDTLFVYHALGGEWNPDQKLRRDPIELFCNPQENRGFGIFTYNLRNSEKYNLDSIVRCWYQKGYTFDMSFDLKTDDRLYCAEFAYKAIENATASRISFSFSKINKFEFVAVDNLFHNPFCSEKARVRFP